MIEKDQKFTADLKRHNIGQPEKLPEHGGSVRSRIQIKPQTINDSNYSSFYNNGNVSEERLNEPILGQNEHHHYHTRQQSTAKP